MSEIKIEEIKAGDVMEYEHGLFLIIKIDYENGNIHAFKSTFECIVLSIAYVMKYCYYVRSLDMEKIVSFLQGHEWWENQYTPITKNDLGVDCISREAVERIINKWLSHSDYELKDHIYSMTEKIHNLPSVTPIRTKGHWINKDHSFESCSAECSSCHKRSNGYMHDNGFSLECKYYDFCPKCGADMRKVEE